jgi:imidazolonepropionase-like amidohydrolase
MSAVLLTARAAYTAFPGVRLEHPFVLVEGETIQAIGTRDEVLPRAPDTTPLIDLGDAVLLPGFVDAHVHLVFDGGPDPIGTVMSSDDRALRDISSRSAGLLLSAGVTSARDLGSRGMADVAALRHAIARGEATGPALVLAGSPITSPGGHCWFLGGEADSVARAFDLIERQRDEGATWVKVMMSGGFLTETSDVQRPQFDLDAITRIVEFAHARGMGVSCHAHGVEAVRASARAGVDTIEHSTFIGDGGIDFDESVVSEMAINGVTVCPTVNAATHSYPDEYGRGALRRLVEMHSRGVGVVMGTDAGVADVSGDLYAAGLAELVAAGFSTVDVLGFATTGAAAVIGIGDTAGRLAPGMRADLVALRGDPVDDIAFAAEPAFVMAAGRASRETSEARA